MIKIKGRKMKKYIVIAFVMISTLSVTIKSMPENYEDMWQCELAEQIKDSVDLAVLKKSVRDYNLTQMKRREKEINGVQEVLEIIKDLDKKIETIEAEMKDHEKILQEERDFNDLLQKFDNVRINLFFDLLFGLPLSGTLDFGLQMLPLSLNSQLWNMNLALLAGYTLAQPIIQHEKNNIIMDKRIKEGLVTPQEAQEHSKKERMHRQIFDIANF